MKKTGLSRRSVIASLASTSLGPAVFAADPDDDAARKLRAVCDRYSSLDCYQDVATISGKTPGGSFAASSAIAFTAPRRICVQVGMEGRTRSAVIIDGDAAANWVAARGWRELSSADSAIAALRGATALLGGGAYLISTLLLEGEIESGQKSLRRLSGISCVGQSGDCLLLDGELDQQKIRLEIDATSGSVRRLESTSGQRTALTSLDAHLNRRFDFDATVRAVRHHPGRLPVSA